MEAAVAAAMEAAASTPHFSPDGRLMDQPIKNFQEVHPVGSVQAAKPRSRGRFILTSILILLVVGGIVWWSKHGTAPQPTSKGRNSGPMSIVPEVVGKGDIGVNINALGTVTSLGGLLVSQMLTLFPTPVIYLWFDRLAIRFSGRSGEAAQPAE